MILPEPYASILTTLREALQREAAARDVTRPEHLPAEVQLACAGEAIAAFNRGLLFAPDGTTLAPYPDTPDHRRLLVAYVAGYGPIDAYLADDHLEDLFIQGHATIIARYGLSDRPQAPLPGKRLLPGCFRDDAHLIATFLPRLEEVGAVWDLTHRICDATLANGIRFHGILPPPGSRRPVVVHLRRRPVIARFLDDLVRRGTLSRAMAIYLTSAVRAGLTILIVGAPDSGKTTTLDALLLLIDDFEEHLVVIEAQPELAVADPSYRDVVPHLTAHLTDVATADGPARLTQRELVRAAQREAPTRVIVGELRGAEAYDWLQAVDLGAAGSLTTIHGTSVRHGLTKLHTYVLQAGEEIPPAQVMAMIADTVKVVVYQERDRQTGARRMVEIAEVAGYAGDLTVSLNTLFRWDPASQRHVWTGLPSVHADRLAALGLPTGLDQPTGLAAD